MSYFRPRSSDRLRDALDAAFAAAKLRRFLVLPHDCHHCQAFLDHCRDRRWPHVVVVREHDGTARITVDWTTAGRPLTRDELRRVRLMSAAHGFMDIGGGLYGSVWTGPWAEAETTAFRLWEAGLDARGSDAAGGECTGR
jgi:hypothetical protein